MWLFAKRILIIFTGVFFMGGAVHAQESDDIAMLGVILSGQPVETTLFAQQFLDAVPIEQLNAAITELSGKIGMPTQIIPKGDEYEVITATHTMPALIALDDTGKVAGLFFRPPIPLNAQLSDLLAGLAETAMDTSYLVIRDSVILAQKDAQRPMAIGSAFKLAILRVLQDEIATQNRHWDDVIFISPDSGSLPSGILQDFPKNAPITLHTLASLMISRSDNTATDILLGLVGRDTVSAYLDGQFVLSTREFFQLKDDAELADAFAGADHMQKSTISDMLATRALPTVNAGSVQYKTGVEWYMSATALCTLIESVQGLDVFEINPGVANANDWDRIAYKGGSEVGVLNLTTWLHGQNGQQYCVVFSANDTSAALPESQASAAYAALLGHLVRQN